MSGQTRKQETEREKKKRENERMCVCVTIYRCCVSLNTAEVEACVFCGAE